MSTEVKPQSGAESSASLKQQQSGAESLVSLKQQRTNMKKNISALKSKIEKDASKLDATILECRLEILESYFKQICHIQTQIEKLAPEDNHRSDLEEVFISAKASLLSHIEEKRHNRSFDASIVHNTTYSGGTSISRLPNLKLPKFDGKYANYKRFMSSFDHLVHKDPGISNIDKFNYLLSCLSGPALAVIEAFQVSNENYPKAIALLKERYDNNALIFQDHISELFSIPKMTSSDPLSLRNIIDTVNALRSSLLSLGSELDITNSILIHMVLTKVDGDTKLAYDEKQEFEKLPSWEDCYKILNRRCQLLENRIMACDKQRFCEKPKPSTKRTSHTFVTSKMNCPFCKATNHYLSNCPSFLDKPVAKRFDFVKKSGLCINCLTKGHTVSNCKSSFRCRICQSAHHTKLHVFPTSLQSTTSSEQQIQSSVAEPIAEQSPFNTATSLIARSMKAAIIPTAVVLIKDKLGSMQPVRALLDSCSELNFMTEETAKRLQLDLRHTNQEVSGIGNIKTNLKHTVYATVHSRISNFEWSSDFSITKTISSAQPGNFINVTNWEIPKNLQLADPLFYKPQKIDLLISTEIFFDLLLHGKLSLGDGMPTLVNTVFGWIVGGTHPTQLKTNSLHCNLIRESSTLDVSLERFWEIESYKQTTTPFTIEETNSEQHFIQNVSILDTGRVQVRLPFKENPELLGNSFECAKRRFLSLERKLLRDPSLHKMYQEFIDEYNNLQHMTRIHNVDFRTPHYFLPHHCVLKPQSLTTKLRVVFDASAKTCSNYSLNDILMVGPTIQQDLITTLLSFRLNKFAMTADISKMYRQFLIDERDRCFQLILWRNTAEEELAIFQLNTITYGMSSAPFQAIRCLFYIADTYKREFPIGAAVLKSDMYVDDLLTGGDTVNELITKKLEITALLSKAGLQLAKWNSNSEEIASNSSDAFKIKTNEDDVAKALGMSWKPKLDLFCFQFEIDNENSHTKRSVLSTTAKIFDLLGLLSPVVIRCKILVQELWLQNLQWDDPLPETLNTQWAEIKQDLILLNEINIPRYVFTSKERKSEVHGFADASQRAYGCCIYTRTTIKGVSKINLLIAKSKVAPVKAQSLPRLELCAALLLCRTWNKFKHKLEYLINDIYFWTDSKIVLQWLKMHSSTLNCFVANRVSEIQESSRNVQWRHVPSKENPADIVSRGCTAAELPKTIWFSGPDFLQYESEKWPLNIVDNGSIAKIEMRKGLSLKCTNSIHTESVINSIINNKSSYYHILRIVSYILRIFNKFPPNRTLQPASIIHISPKELDTTFWIIVANIQAEVYSYELKCLTKESSISTNLKTLSPFVHEFNIGYKTFNILRVGGRLANAELPFDAKFPALLPKDHRFVQLYIEFLHKKHLHAGPKVLIALLRQRLWVVNAREAVRKVVRSCVHCFHYKPRLMNQIMGNLPADRLRAQRPFLTSGVDFCGPFQTSYRIRGKPPYKTYIAIFVCFASKACHLELVSELSTNAFLSCIKRFIARRGVPKRIYCDNATNFVGADRKLKQFRDEFLKTHQNDLITFCNMSGFEFSFIPPRAPHFGGLWEAAVKSTKQLLVKNVSEANLTFEELNTVVTEVEAILNSRPMCANSDDPNDGEALTPAHLLIGSSLMTVPDEPLNSNNFSYLNRWQRITYLKQRFWDIWKRDYILQLQQRAKWFQSNPNIRVGQLVVIHEDNTPPQTWPLARVTRTVAGKDGRVRVVDVSNSRGTLRRPIHKIAPLPEVLG